MYNPNEMRDTHGRWVVLGAQQVSFMIHKRLNKHVRAVMAGKPDAEIRNVLRRQEAHIRARLGNHKEFHVRVVNAHDGEMHMDVHPVGAPNHVAIHFPPQGNELRVGDQVKHGHQSGVVATISGNRVQVKHGDGRSAEVPYKEIERIKPAPYHVMTKPGQPPRHRIVTRTNFMPNAEREAPYVPPAHVAGIGRGSQGATHYQTGRKP